MDSAHGLCLIQDHPGPQQPLFWHFRFPRQRLSKFLSSIKLDFIFRTVVSEVLGRAMNSLGAVDFGRGAQYNRPGESSGREEGRKSVRSWGSFGGSMIGVTSTRSPGFTVSPVWELKARGPVRAELQCNV